MLLPIFLILALLGLLLSLAVHASALAGIDVQDRFPAVMLLHVGIFVVFVPAIMAAKKWGNGTKHFWKGIGRAVPFGIGTLIVPLFLYTAINFLWMLSLLSDGSPQQRDNHFELRNHGQLVREIDAREYHLMRAHEARMFSGHWILFYYISMLILWAELRYRQGVARRPY